MTAEHNLSSKAHHAGARLGWLLTLIYACPHLIPMQPRVSPDQLRSVRSRRPRQQQPADPAPIALGSIDFASGRKG